MTRLRAVSALLLALLVLPVVAETQPRPSTSKYPRSMSTREIRDFLLRAQYPFTITVCNSAVYGGDYKDLGDALAAVATKFPTRGVNQRVTVLVYACDTTDGASNGAHYEEASYTIPTWTTVQGVTAPWNGATDQTGRVVIRATNTAGTLFTMGQGSSVMNAYIQQKSQVPTGAIEIVSVTSASPSALTNVQIASTNATGFAVRGLVVAGGTVIAHGLGITGPSSANFTGAYFSGSGTGTLYGGVINTPGGQGLENAGSGAVRLYGTRFLSATALTDIVGTSGTTEVLGVDYLTESGTVTGKPVRTDSVVLSQSCTILSGSGAPEGAVTAPACSIYLRTAGGSGTTLCVKESGTGNTGWVCK